METKIDNGDYKRVINIYQRRGTKILDQYNTKVNLGRCLFYLKEYQSAKEHFEQSVNIDKSHSEPYYYLALIDRYLEISDGSAYTLVALSWDPTLSKAWYLLGKIYFEQEQYANCIDSFEFALKFGHEPTDEFYLKQAIAHYELNNMEKVYSITEQLIKTYPTTEHYKLYISLLGEELKYTEVCNLIEYDMPQNLIDLEIRYYHANALFYSNKKDAACEIVANLLSKSFSIQNQELTNYCKDK